MTESLTTSESLTKVDLLNYLHVSLQADESSDLLMIKASGISENENVGIPKLVPVLNDKNFLTTGILEFNFFIQTDHLGIKNKLAWDISVVYQMDALPQGIKAIKVNAAHNADIALLLN